MQVFGQALDLPVTPITAIIIPSPVPGVTPRDAVGLLSPDSRLDARRWSDTGRTGGGPGPSCGPGSTAGLALGRGFCFFPKHIGLNFEWGVHCLSPAEYLPGLLFGV